MNDNIVEVNIGLLDADGQRVSNSTIVHSTMVLRSLGVILYVAIEEVVYDHKYEEIREPTLVARIGLNKSNNIGVLAQTLDQLARDVKQEAISFYYPNLPYGDLVGPKADEWRPFNMSYFKRPGGVPCTD